MATVITTSTYATATAYGNQRKVDRTSNGVLWALYFTSLVGSTGGPQFRYSTDNGATWTAGGNIPVGTNSPTSPMNGSLFIDVDDYAHVAYKADDNFIYYRRGTPNAARTAWTWSAAVVLSNSTATDYPDVVAFREGTGWVAYAVYSYATSTSSQMQSNRIDIASGGTITAGARTGISANYSHSAVAHGWPSIDFHHTGDGKTIAGGTPHLYAGWSAGKTGAGFGVRFRKATYSAGSWTWGTEREIDSTKYVIDPLWLACLFDGTRVIIGGYLWAGTASTHYLRIYERDVADTTTTARNLLDAPTSAEWLYAGSMTYDGAGNVYLFGANADEAVGSRDLVYRKWTRSTLTLGAEVVVDATVGEKPYLSAKRGYSDQRIEFAWTDGTASPYSVTYDAVTLNVAPNAPTGLSPSNNVTIDRDATQRFSWTFSDPDGGDTQSGYDGRYRAAGTTSWTTFSGTTPNSYHDFPAGTFPAADYEWQVRTYDAAGAVGPYSSSAFFTAASAPATPSITDPVNGQTIAEESYTARWSAPSQEAYQVRTVADAAGVPDATTVYTDSGIVESSSARSRTVTFATNNRDEHVQVRIRVSGLWSSWASVRVTVSYTVPQTPRITAVGEDGNGLVRVEVDAPPAPPGLPTFTRASTAHLDGVEVASGVPRYPYGRNLLTAAASRNAHEHASNVDGWINNPSAGVTRVDNGDGWTRVTVDAANKGIRGYVDLTRLVGGQTYTVSADLRNPSTSDAVVVVVDWTDQGITGFTLQPGEERRVSVSGARATYDSVYRFTDLIVGSAEAGRTFDVRNVQVEQGGTATPWRPGGPSAVLVEEGTTNLLTANQASIETDTTGWAAGAGTTIARSTAVAWHGAASLSLVNSSGGVGTALADTSTRPAVTAGTTYTATAYFRAAATAREVRVVLRWYDSAGAFLSVSEGPVGVNNAVGTWTRYTVTGTAPTNAASVMVRLAVMSTAANEEHYADGVQVEAKGYATSWHTGGAARNAEQLLLPGESTLPIKGAGGTGTIEVDATVLEPHLASARVFEFTRGDGSQNGFLVFRSAAGTWNLYATNDAGTVTQVQATGVAEGMKRFAVSWDADGVRYYIDGVLKGTMAASALPSGFGTRYIGRRNTGHHLNRPILGFRVSDRARTATELADWTAPLTADDATTYLLRFEGDLAYATGHGEFDGTENYPDPIAARIYRTGPDGEILLAVVTPDATYLDRTAGARTAYTYRAVSVGDNGTTATSTSTAPVTLDLSGVWIHPATAPETARHYIANGDGGESRRTVEKALRRFAGRSLPVVEFGEGREEEVRANLALTDHDAWQYLVDLEATIVLYRDSSGRRLFGTVDLGDASTFYGRDVDLTVVAVDYDEAVAP